MTFKPALEFGDHVRKGEKGSLVVYASSITRIETHEATGAESERDIPFMKRHTVFNVEQAEGLPANFYAMAQPVPDPVHRIARAERFFAKKRRRHSAWRPHGVLPYLNRSGADAVL
jgi:antirestriction protein ArdC